MPNKKGETKSVNAVIECICPKCENTHKMRLFWTGTTIPKMYCPSCKQSFNDNLEMQDPDRYVRHTRSIKCGGCP